MIFWFPKMSVARNRSRVLSAGEREQMEVPGRIPTFSSCCVAEDQVKAAESFSPLFVWVKQTPSPCALAA